MHLPHGEVLDAEASSLEPRTMGRAEVSEGLTYPHWGWTGPWFEARAAPEHLTMREVGGASIGRTRFRVCDAPLRAASRPERQPQTDSAPTRPILGQAGGDG